MNRLLSFLAVAAIALLTFGATAAKAQNGAIAPYVDAGVSVSSSSTPTNSISLGGITLGGVSNPNFYVGAGIESSTKHFLLDLNGQFNSQNPTATFLFGGASSINGTIDGSGYYKLGGHVLVGGGARYSMTVSSYSIKGIFPTSLNEFVPYVGGGVQFSRDRFIADYVLPGRSAVAGQREVDFHNEIFLTKGAHFRLTQDVAFNSAVPMENTGAGIFGRITGVQAGAGLKVVF